MGKRRVDPENERRILTLLAEIREGQKQALELQRRHVESYESYVTDSQRRVDESLAMQKEAVAKQKQALRYIFPVIVVGIVAIALLVWGGVMR